MAWVTIIDLILLALTGVLVSPNSLNSTYLRIAVAIFALFSLVGHWSDLKDLFGSDNPPNKPRVVFIDDFPPNGQPKPSDGDSVWGANDGTVTDSSGKKAKIRVITLSRDFNWKKGSASEIERRGESVDMKNYFAEEGIKYAIKSCKGLIVVGASSEEGASLEQEIKRAKDRADQLQFWIKTYVNSLIPIYTLSIGEHKATRNEDTSEQRKVVIIGVISKEDGINLEEALKNTLSKEMGFPFVLADYSSFELETFRDIGVLNN